MSFNAHCTRGEEDVTTVVGTKGTLRSRGSGLNDQPEMELHLQHGSVTVPLDSCCPRVRLSGNHKRTTVCNRGRSHTLPQCLQ